MPARKMRVELFDSEGNKYTVSFEGQITREKALKIMDLLELLGGVSGGTGGSEINLTATKDGVSKFEKLRVLVQKNFPLVWFSSKEVQSAYEQEFKEPISLSTVATYVARMTNKGILAKVGASNRLKYKVAPNFVQTALKQEIP